MALLKDIKLTKYGSMGVKRFLLIFFISKFGFLVGQNSTQIFKAAGMPANPKVNIIWYRYYDSKGLETLMRKIANAYPNLAKMGSIGKSYQGKDLWCLTITDHTKGRPDKKPAVYLQGNIHGNEMQGSEFSLYTAWYLTEMFRDTKAVQELLATKTFYIVPTVNPDSRDFYIHTPAGTHHTNSRYSIKMISDLKLPPNAAGGFTDMDGDGHITNMRTCDPKGIYQIDKIDSRFMRRISPDSLVVANGRLESKYPSSDNFFVYEEGEIWLDKSIENLFADDNNQYNLARNWGWWWSKDDSVSLTNALQRERDALKKNNEFVGDVKWFPQPETRAVKDFFILHPNIVAAESFHNSGGIFVTPVGMNKRSASSREEWNDPAESYRSDVEITKSFEKDLVRMFGRDPWPGKELIFNEGKFQEHSWMYKARGVYSYVAELWNDDLLYRKPFVSMYDTTGMQDLQKENWEEDARKIAINQFIDELAMGDAYVPWQKITHPQLGEIEVGGGYKKNFGRLHVGFTILEEAHRHMAYSVLLANQTPKLSMAISSTKILDSVRREIVIEIKNSSLLPTHSSPDVLHNITPPDYLTIEGCAVEGAELIEISANGDSLKISLKKSKVWISNIPGYSSILVKCAIKGNKKAKISLASVKGGSCSVTEQ